MDHISGMRKGGGKFPPLTNSVNANPRGGEKKSKREKGKEGGTNKNSSWERKGERRKEKLRISQLSDGRSSTVRRLKLVHAARSMCGH